MLHAAKTHAIVKAIDLPNLYLYVDNNPVNETDPTGLFGEESGILLAQAPTPTPPQVYPERFGDWPKRPAHLQAMPKNQVTYLPREVTPQFAEPLRKHVREQIPSAILDALARANVKLAFTDKILNKNANDTIRGVYVSEWGAVYVPEKLTSGAPNSNPERAIRHEFGHAVDHMLNVSTTDKFLQAFRADLQGVNNRGVRRDLLEQFIPNQITPLEKAAREAFAEAFAIKTRAGNQAEGAHQAEFKRVFKNTVTVVGQVVDDFVKQNATR